MTNMFAGLPDGRLRALARALLYVKVSDVIKKNKSNAVDHKRKENSNDGKDEHQGRQRSMGWLINNQHEAKIQTRWQGRELKNFRREESSHDGKDQQQGWQRSMGWLRSPASLQERICMAPKQDHDGRSRR
jgi:hypothetical protein